MSVDSFDDAIALMRSLDGFTERVAQRAAPELASILDAQFDAGVDPYGSEWSPLSPATISKGRSAPPLTDSGAMHGGAQVIANGSEIEMRVDSPAEFHQGGTRDMPARPILPEDELPPAYEEAIVASVNELVDELG